MEAPMRVARFRWESKVDRTVKHYGMLGYVCLEQFCVLVCVLCAAGQVQVATSPNYKLEVST